MSHLYILFVFSRNQQYMYMLNVNSHNHIPSPSPTIILCASPCANNTSDEAQVSEDDLKVCVPMAQEYEAVTTLLRMCGTDTKTTNKQEVFLNLVSKNTIFMAYFQEM